MKMCSTFGFVKIVQYIVSALPSVKAPGTVDEDNECVQMNDYFDLDL